MEPGHSTQAIWVMAVFAGAAAVVLDDPVFYFGTCSLVILSAVLALRFRQQMHRVVASVRCTRSADKKILQQSGTATITTVFSSEPAPALHLRFADMIPPTARSDPADPCTIAAADGSATLRYSITPLVPGSISMPGIMLTVSDPFFSSSLVMAADAFRGPELEVHPHSAYERSRIRKDTGPQEKDLLSIYRGSAIRSIREYVSGDDLRSIDWKMTAKHNRMYVRQYTVEENLPPLVVLDLPDRSFPVPDEQLSKIVNGATGEIAAAIRHYGSVSLFIISGANVIDMLLEETDLGHCIFCIRSSAHPRFRPIHAYRWKDRAGMQGFVRKLVHGQAGPNNDEAGLFQARIAQLYRKSLSSPYVPVFSTQVSRLFSSLKSEELIIYSLFEGDLSHIREIALQAQMQRIRLKTRTVAGPDRAKFASIRRALDIDTLEMIP